MIMTVAQNLVTNSQARRACDNIQQDKLKLHINFSLNFSSSVFISIWPAANSIIFTAAFRNLFIASNPSGGQELSPPSAGSKLKSPPKYFTPELSQHPTREGRRIIIHHSLNPATARIHLFNVAIAFRRVPIALTLTIQSSALRIQSVAIICFAGQNLTSREVQVFWLQSVLPEVVKLKGLGFGSGFHIGTTHHSQTVISTD